ncbi:PREDICTED: uncharacterized protein LOC104754160 [Camelina sativa]|uniref:Uncharacterized protein LOC104754160 n=1 Tax=Camelina sativa TaxID=90675 RepID=A0ABM0WQ74_CAMSA|nr:PREDICTED: uncharacterized protein LOC104754160 [Camelina sativa]
MWRDSVGIKILHSDKRIIDVQVKWQDKVFYLSCIYGDPVRGARGGVWERLTRIGISRSGPWMLTGDFNELVDPSEKIGGLRRELATCLEFQQMLRACGLWEIKHRGYQFSWFGNRNDELVQCRLDRTVANQEWSKLFPQGQATYLKKVSSDHSPLINSLMGENWRKWASFKYDQRWVQREGFVNHFNQVWNSEEVRQADSLVAKISLCRKGISRWKRQSKLNSAIRIQSLHHQIDLATQQRHSNPEEVHRLKQDLNAEHLREEIFWQQKSRSSWLNNGDKNTKYFHATTKNRRAQNRIQILEDDEGKQWSADKDLGRVAEQFFRKLYTSEDVGYKLQMMSEIIPLISREMNEYLLTEVTVEEVKRAVFDINPNKCPGPDGMTGFFFQQFWDVIGEDIVNMVKTFFQSGKLEKDINRTNICLIPKKLKAVKLAEFRPISLSNVVYKIISKVMAKRLTSLLPDIISETQAAFIKGRLITDNILIAHELLHALSSNNKCAEEFIAIKTDLSKAFDRVEWQFLDDAMQSLGFSEHWRAMIMECVSSVQYQVLINGSPSNNKCAEEFIAIKTDLSKAFDRVEWQFLDDAMQSLGFSEHWRAMIMECVSSVQYQVLINGSPYGDIRPTRGLRQGDPLSPYLFLICTEMLVKMFQHAENNGKITGLQVARGSPPITNLLFADDSMFYCKKSDSEINQVISIIEEYSLASGQRVNYEKSSVYFGKLIPDEERGNIKHNLGINQEGGEGIYLGLPESFKGSKVNTLSYLKERMHQKVNGWQSLFLSPGGKEVLLKAVAMALPTHTMSCFKLPTAICKQLTSVMSDFWWQNKQDSRGMHWTAWEKLSKPKAVGGLGFRDIEDFNLALLGKQLWRMITHKDSLLARVYKSRYFKHSDPLSASLGNRPSFAWRSIHASQKIIKQGARAVIGNGASVNIWQHQWVEEKPSRGISRMKVIPPQFQRIASSVNSVQDLLLPSGKDWNETLLELLFEDADRVCIRGLRPGSATTKDVYAWDYSRSGHYSVKSGYWVATQVIKGKDQPQFVLQPSLDLLYQQIWKLDAPPKLHHFIWRCISNNLSVAGNLYHPHISREASCIRCPNARESTNHLLFTCPLSRLVWAISPIPAPPEGDWSNSIYANLFWVFNYHKELPSQENLSSLSPWILWRIWKNRNNLIFKGREYEAISLINKAKEDAEEWSQRLELRGIKHPNPPGSLNRNKWIKPSQDWVKCNSDGAWPHDGDTGGLGWVLRDNRGKILWAGVRLVSKTRTVLEIEAEAFRWAVINLVRLQYPRVIFESDSQTLVDLLNGEGSRPTIDPIVQDIRHHLPLFDQCKVVFIKRSGNGVADRIAQESLSFQNFDPKLYAIEPSWLKSLVDADIV